MNIFLKALYKKYIFLSSAKMNIFLKALYKKIHFFKFRQNEYIFEGVI